MYEIQDDDDDDENARQARTNHKKYCLKLYSRNSKERKKLNIHFDFKEIAIIMQCNNACNDRNILFSFSSLYKHTLYSIVEKKCW